MSACKEAAAYIRDNINYYFAGRRKDPTMLSAIRLAVGVLDERDELNGELHAFEDQVSAMHTTINALQTELGNQKKKAKRARRAGYEEAIEEIESQAIDWEEW